MWPWQLDAKLRSLSDTSVEKYTHQQQKQKKTMKTTRDHQGLLRAFCCINLGLHKAYILLIWTEENNKLCHSDSSVLKRYLLRSGLFSLQSMESVLKHVWLSEIRCMATCLFKFCCCSVCVWMDWRRAVLFIFSSHLNP